MNELNQQLLKQWTDAGHAISEFMDEYHSFVAITNTNATDCLLVRAD